MEIDAESFVGIKGVKARGRRVTAYNVKDVEELVPLRMPEPAPEPDNAEIESDEPDNADNADDENTEKADDGQLSLF
jgi:topoisomerase-4 subunit A